MIHLDTSFLIRAFVRGSPQDLKLREWLRAGEQVVISAIGWAELLCGPIEAECAQLAASIVPQRVPFTDEDATVAAQLFNSSGRRRGSLMDCMIAANAIRFDAGFATANPRDFRRFDQAGLRIIAT